MDVNPTSSGFQINSSSQTMEEMQTALAKAHAKLQESLEHNRKMAEAAKATEDTLSNLKKELESAKSN